MDLAFSRFRFCFWAIRDSLTASSTLGNAMSKPRDDRHKDLLLPALDQIIDMGHPLVRLAALIDWTVLTERFSSVCQAGSGQPGLPTRLVAGLFILKHMHNLSDEALCARWIENPYYQHFCGELSFRHGLPFARSSMTRWRQRLGEEQLVALIQESLSVAHNAGAIGAKDLERVVVDTTVQPKAVAHPTDARLMHRAIIKLVTSPGATVCRCARAICAWPSAPPSWLAAIPTPTSSNVPGGSSSSCGHGLAGSSATSAARLKVMPGLEARFGPLLGLAQQVRSQDQHQRGPKVYALHAPEVECIRKGKARALRVRLQGQHRHPCDVSEGRLVRAPRQGPSRQSLRWAHARPRDRRYGEAHRRGGSP
ncbi:IS5 family transposase [Bradyrhizobium sp. SBR1B]|nr:IS5 family transposase [Bradyrhizobium sp. SBR1B]